MNRDKFFIGGEWVAPAGNDTLAVISPSTEEVIAKVPDATTADVDRAVAAAREAFDNGPWPLMAPAERADVMAEISQAIQARVRGDGPRHLRGDGLADLVLGHGPGVRGHDGARLLHGPRPRVPVRGASPRRARARPSFAASRSAWWARSSRGTCPLFVTMLKLAPALASGSTVVLKPAPETPLDAYLLADIVAETGLPEGVLNIVQAGREVSEHIVTHPDVDKISFTGSTVAGKKIAALCGEQLKRCTLELGGKSAAIILDDADLAATIPGLMPNALDEQRRGVRRPDPHPRVA